MDSANFNSPQTEIIYSLVIPCYNESENLLSLVDRCIHLLNEKEKVEIIIVDNGSIDDTEDILKDLLKNCQNDRFRSVRVNQNIGYGNGILVGLGECKGNILGWTHADLQADPVDFLSAISLINQSEDSKQVFIKGARVGRPFMDVFFTWGMSLVEWFILGERLWDINAQPTVFSRDFFISLHEPPLDFSIDLYFYHEAVRRKYSIRRFPVDFKLRLKGVGHNDKLLSKVKYSWKTLNFSLGLRKYIKDN